MLIVDSFAGGGGASLGIARALGRAPDIAINHDAAALAMHAANHPETRHVREDVWQADLRRLVGGRPVGLLWASPDCKHFSRAKGAKPVEKSIRSLAWVVVRWASQVKPRVIILENVREFADWGPLVPQWTCRCGWKGTEGQAILARTRRRCPRCETLRITPSLALVPDPERKGFTFRLFCNRLRGYGYRVEWRNLDAADFGAPAHRRRLFLVARCDGASIEWPEPTHADPRKLDATPLFAPLRPWRTAAECLDWSIPCPSIFDRKKPLAEKTLRRIAHGFKRYVLDAAEPFIVPITHSGPRRCHGLDEPAPTVTTAHRGEYAIVTPYVVGVGGRAGQSPATGGEQPLGTVTAKNDRAVVTPYLVPRYGERAGQAPRAAAIDVPMGVIVPTANAGDLVAPILAKYHHAKRDESRCQSPREPFTTLDTQPRFAQVAAMLKHYGGVVGHELNRPLGTVTGVDHHSLMAANLVRMNHGEKQWAGIDEPLMTVTSQGNKAALVYSFLVKYFGTAIGSEFREPLPTATGKHRFGVVTVTIDGQAYAIVDIGMRMLTPRELARAQGFPDTYVLTGTKTNQVARIGNSVCPVMAHALVAANLRGAGVETGPDEQPSGADLSQPKAADRSPDR